MKLFVVMHPSGTGVAFTERADADYASTGAASRHFMGVDTIADVFRATFDDNHGTDDDDNVPQFPLIEVELTLDQIAQLKL